MEKKVYIVITEDDEPFIQGVFSEQIHAQAYADKDERRKIQECSVDLMDKLNETSWYSAKLWSGQSYENVYVERFYNNSRDIIQAWDSSNKGVCYYLRVKAIDLTEAKKKAQERFRFIMENKDSFFPLLNQYNQHHLSPAYDYFTHEIISNDFVV